MTTHRFFIPPEDLAAAEASAEPRLASLRGPEHHHLHRVLRLAAGEPVALFDGAGRGHFGVLASIDGDSATVRLTAPDTRDVEPRFRLTLAQGIPQHDRMDLIVQKTTELGVFGIVPIAGARTGVKTAAPGEWKRLDRWRRIARDAARQSGRLRVPVVADPLVAPVWLRDGELPPSWRGAGLFVLCPDAGGAPLEPADLAAAAGAAVVAVGPEGGWTAEEVDRATAAGFRRVSLGPRVLRTETAGIVAVALLLYLAGEMRGTTG